jgi:hypothetical protein
MPSRTIPVDLPQKLAELSQRIANIELELAELRQIAAKPVVNTPQKPAETPRKH